MESENICCQEKRITLPLSPEAHIQLGLVHITNYLQRKSSWYTHIGKEALRGQEKYDYGAGHGCSVPFPLLGRIYKVVWYGQLWLCYGFSPD